MNLLHGWGWYRWTVSYSYWYPLTGNHYPFLCMCQIFWEVLTVTLTTQRVRDHRGIQSHGEQGMDSLPSLGLHVHRAAQSRNTQPTQPFKWATSRVARQCSGHSKWCVKLSEWYQQAIIGYQITDKRNYTTSSKYTNFFPRGVWNRHVYVSSIICQYLPIPRQLVGLVQNFTHWEWVLQERNGFFLLLFED